MAPKKDDSKKMSKKAEGKRPMRDNGPAEVPQVPQPEPKTRKTLQQDRPSQPPPPAQANGRRAQSTGSSRLQSIIGLNEPEQPAAPPTPAEPALRKLSSPEAASDVAESHEKDQNNPANGQICRNGKLVNKEGVDKKGTSARESEATGALLATMMAVSDSESNADGTVTEPRDNSQSMRTRTGPVLDAHGRRSSGKILQVPEKNSRGYYHLDMKAVLGKGHTYNQPPVQEKTHPDSTTTASADEPVSIPLSKFRSDEEQVQYITAHNQRLVARNNQKEADAGSKKRKNSMMAGLETAAKRPRGDLFPPGMKECIESKPEGVDDVEENGP